MRRGGPAVAIAAVVALSAGCGGDDPAATIDDFVDAYNSGDIDAVMSLFSEESVLDGHPFGNGEVAGLAEIRALHIGDLAAAAEEDAYEIVDIEVSGETVTWDHRWTNAGGTDYCGEGNVAVVTDGTILTWTFAPEREPCG